jgi:AcrR family transcriptional regulator
VQVLKEKPGTKRPAIVAAATSLFARVGVDATSMRDIADAAGVREAAIYRHFIGKEQMAQEIFASWYGWYGRQVRQIVEGKRPARAKLRALSIWNSRPRGTTRRSLCIFVRMKLGSSPRSRKPCHASGRNSSP